MNVWKKIGCLGLSAALLLGLVGCTEPEETAPTSTEETRPSINGYDWENPGHYTEQINEFLSIDATIRGPKDGKIPAIYEMKKFETKSEDLQPFLEATNDSIVSVNYLEENPDKGPEYQEYSFRGTTASNHSIATAWYPLTPTSVPYSNGDHVFFYQHPDDEIYDLFNHYGMDSQREDPYKEQNHNTSVLFQEPKEFSFGSAEDFTDKMIHLMELLEIHDVVVQDIYYMDHEAMTAALTNPEFTIDVKVPYPEGYTFAEDTDAYLYTFTQMKDGIPPLQHSFERVTVRYSGPKMEAIYNQDGLLCMELMGFYNFGNVLEVPERIMTADEALDKAMEIIQKSNPSFRRIVDDISIQYYPYQDKDQWTYRPCWVIAVLNPDKVFIGPAPDHTIILLDAITGKEI